MTLTNTSKIQARKTVNTKIGSLDASMRSLAGTKISSHLCSALITPKISTILAFASLNTEIPLDPFITQAQIQGIQICIPRMNWDTKTMDPVLIENLDEDLELGRYGIRVPSNRCSVVEPKQLDLIFVPGLAFDRQMNRLGRGGGFYDRFIDRLNHEFPSSQQRPPLVGVCYSCQIIDKVPTEPHDHPMDRVITEIGELKSEIESE